MNLSRAKRRWKAWDRYAHRLFKIGGACAVPPGYSRAAGQRYRVWLRKRERQERRNGRPLTADLLADVIAMLDSSRAAA